MAAVPAAVGRPAGGALHAFAVAVETGAGLEIPAIAAVALEGAERHDGIGVAAGAAIPVHRLAVRGVFESAAGAIPVEPISAEPDRAVGRQGGTGRHIAPQDAFPGA